MNWLRSTSLTETLRLASVLHCYLSLEDNLQLKFDAAISNQGDETSQIFTPYNYSMIRTTLEREKISLRPLILT